MVQESRRWLALHACAAILMIVPAGPASGLGLSTTELAVEGHSVLTFDDVPRSQRWSHTIAVGDEVDIDLIRAQVTVQEGTSTAVEFEMIAEAPPGQEHVLSARLDWSPGKLVLSDRFPPRLGLMSECLPPADERGDYWTTSARLRIEVWLPRNVRLKVHVRDGEVKDFRPGAA